MRTTEQPHILAQSQRSSTYPWRSTCSAPSAVDERSAANPAYVASMVSVSPIPAWNVFRGGECRSMYVSAEA